jgi:hypothetical protein
VSELSQKEKARQRRLANLKPFKKGVSGNPGGVPKPIEVLTSPAEIARAEQRKIITDVREAAKAHTEKAISTLNRALDAEQCPWPAKITAAQALLDRGWGKPTESVKAEVGFDLEMILRRGRERAEAAERQRLLIEGEKSAP